MSEKLIRNDLLGEQYYEIDHKSGLKIFVMEKPDYSGAFAMFGTKYGSVDTCFRIKGQEDYVCVPEGIAHFLEHKLFESEELDAFQRFSETGANANAFTSFDRTCYIFQCAGEFEKNLEINYLLDFYGEVLSERKREVLEMYYNEDLSLAEIANDIGISRQGVRDIIKKSEDELVYLEEKLGLLKKFRSLQKKADELLTEVEASDASAEIKDKISKFAESVRSTI